MSALSDYVFATNKWYAIFKKPALDMSRPADRHSLAARISGELSPENLHCDGEISPAEAARKYKRLMAVAKELAALDPTVRIDA
jgi:hypothetical protein